MTLSLVMSNPLNLGQVGAGRPYGYLHDYLKEQGKQGRIEYRFISGAAHVQRLYGNAMTNDQSFEQGAMSDQLVSFDEDLDCDVFLGCGCASTQQLDRIILHDHMDETSSTTLITSWFSSHYANASKILIEEGEKVGIKNPMPVDPFLMWRDEKEHEMSDILLVPSVECARTYEEHDACNSKTRVVPFGVDSKKFHPEEKRGVEGEEFRVMFVGGNWIRKGLPYLVKAWNGLHLNDGVLTTAGCTVPPVAIHRHAGLGWVSDEELPKLYRRNPVFCLPTMEEGSALACYEAAASGCAIITTREAGFPMEDGKECIIIPSGDVDALASAILRLHDSPKERRELGEKARDKAITLTWEKFGEGVLRVCEEAVSK